MKAEKEGKYVEGIGRRKTSIARVRIIPGEKNSYSINSKSLEEYFAVGGDRDIVVTPLREATPALHFAVSVSVNGGGIHSQAEAIKLGLARAIIGFDKQYRKQLFMALL